MNHRRFVSAGIALMMLLLTILPVLSFAEEEEDWSIVEEVYLDDEGNEIPADEFEKQRAEDEAAEDAANGSEADETEYTPRDDMIDRIVALGKEKYEQTGGKAQRAHYSGDIYVCKNFTVYLFRQVRDAFRMAEFPDVSLVIPNNLPSAKCKPYYYGFLWEEIPPEKGNPFYVAAQFAYDKSLSKEENMEKACEFMRQAQRGDYFQMSANYEYGVGAHSAIMLGYDAERDEIHWMDSNMRGKKVKGIWYGIVQFDETREVSWWASNFCWKGRGATLYRLRDDIIYAP